MKADHELSQYIAGLNDLNNAMNILNWNARTQMPAGGNAARGQVLATLSDLAQEKLVSDDLQRLIEQSASEITGRYRSRNCCSMIGCQSRSRWPRAAAARRGNHRDPQGWRLLRGAAPQLR